jgi:predicted ribosomally synthesized peptide with SipW-like signal peptide
MVAGLGVVGLASAGAGVGTSAFFSDEESFENNTLTAGTLDMSVTANVVAADDYWTGQGALDLSETADGDVVSGIQVDDVKPGDWAVICFDIEVGDNPGYVQVRTEEFVENGGANPEPEQDVEGDTDNDADLGEFLLTTVWQDYDETSGDKTGLSTLDPVFNNASDALDIDYEPPVDVDGVVDGDAHYTNAREANAVLENGYLIKDDNGDLLPINDEANEGVYSFCLLLEIPFQVGNVIQGDSISFDLVFETEQVRHNEDPFNNTVPVNNSTGGQ